MNVKELAEMMEKIIVRKVETGIIKQGIRKWYNPFRYIKGKIYRKYATRILSNPNGNIST